MSKDGLQRIKVDTRTTARTGEAKRVKVTVSTGRKENLEGIKEKKVKMQTGEAEEKIGITKIGGATDVGTTKVAIARKARKETLAKAARTDSTTAAKVRTRL